MPRKSKVETVLVNVRMTPEQVKRIDELVDRGVYVSRSEFVKDAIQFKVYLEENRAGDFTVMVKPRDHSQEQKNNP